MSWEVTASNSGGGSSELPPDGNHPGVLVGLIDLGTHEDTYKERTSEVRKVLFAWELPAEHQSNGSPFILIQDYNALGSLSQKSKLRLMLEGWRGRPFGDGETLDLEVLILKPCLINVVHAVSKGTGNPYARIDAIKPPVKGMATPRPFTTPLVWRFDMGLPFPDPSWLPFLYGEPVADVIRKARESRGSNGVPARQPEPVGAGVGADDDIPF